MHPSRACLLGVLLFAATASADELRLKDGSKIVGTIVGFEENSFKVQTSYGFAVVRKDQVVSIVVASAEKKASEKKTPEPPAKTLASPEPQTKADATPAEPGTPSPAPTPSKALEETAPVKPAKTVASSAPSKEPEESTAPAKRAKRVASTPPTKVAEKSEKMEKTPAPEAPVVARKQQTPAPAAAPPKPAPPPVPEQIREEVSGNSYANLTFGFRMYKPPDWQVIEGARKMLPDTITAMGTGDETTYLLIGQEPLSGPAEPHIVSTERRLRDALDNYRLVGERQITVAGTSAHQQRFRGMANDRDWSGVVVFVTHGDRLFTIFGMTAADSDLVQIQENVISRAISSLEFTKQ